MKYTDYIERKQRGTPDFPLEYYFVDKLHPQYVMPLHWHSDFEIIYVRSGVLSVFLDNKEYELCSGDALLIAPGCLHRADPESCVYECIVLDLNMLIKQNYIPHKLLWPLVSAGVGFSQPLINGGETVAVIGELFSKVKARAVYYELEVYSLLFKMFALLYNKGDISVSKGSSHSHQAQTISDMLNWIERNLSESITLKRLSQISGFSEKYLCRIFKEYTSKTLTQYINELRIERACYDISVNGKNITNSAFDNGFNDLSYFCKTFKKHRGITPNEYKRLVKNR